MKRLLRRGAVLLAILAAMAGFCTASAWELPDTRSEEFEALFPIPPAEFLPPFAFETEVDDSALEGKSILFLGDSYTMGYGLSDFSQSWCAMLETECGMDVTCYSIHGSTLGTGFFPVYCKGGCFVPISLRPLPEETYDIIFVSCGSNDWYCEIPLWDDMDSRDIRTFVGAINTTIDRLEEAYPDAMIVFMTPWVTKGSENFRGETTDDYSRVLAQLCEMRDVVCYEAYLPWVSTMFADNEGFREKYFLTDSDGWHLNAAGQRRFLPVIASWLSEQVEEKEALDSARVSASVQVALTV